jgi:cell filamentation protein
MPDRKYCYPNSEVLINELGITDKKRLFEAEIKFTSARLYKLQENPIKGNYDFKHLKAIHKYIFQDLYSWAGKERTVDIGKGNLFCTTAYIQDYAKSVFNKYFPQCYGAKDNINDFIRVLADNYGDLNALHPFREGNGRAQREFARIVCLKCGYDFDLAEIKHIEMLEASKLSFDKADSSGFIKIFSRAVTPYNESAEKHNQDRLKILTGDDLTIGLSSEYDDYGYYGYEEGESSKAYNDMYKAKIAKMDAEKIISDMKQEISSGKENVEKHSKSRRTEKTGPDDR